TTSAEGAALVVTLMIDPAANSRIEFRMEDRKLVSITEKKTGQADVVTVCEDANTNFTIASDGSSNWTVVKEDGKEISLKDLYTGRATIPVPGEEGAPEWQWKIMDFISGLDFSALDAAESETFRDYLKVNIVTQGVRDFFALVVQAFTDAIEAEYYMPFVQMMLATNPIILLTGGIGTIAAWLTSQGSRITNCAVKSLLEYFAGESVTVEEEKLSAAVIISDIVSGRITPATVGDLETSLFTLKSVAALEGVTLNGVKTTVDRMVGRTMPAIAVIEEAYQSHVVLVQNVTAAEVTYQSQGQAVVESKEEFAKKFSGYVLASFDAVYSDETALTDAELMEVTGSLANILETKMDNLVGYLEYAYSGMVDIRDSLARSVSWRQADQARDIAAAILYEIETDTDYAQTEADAHPANEALQADAASAQEIKADAQELMAEIERILSRIEELEEKARLAQTLAEVGLQLLEDTLIYAQADPRRSAGLVSLARTSLGSITAAKAKIDECTGEFPFNTVMLGHAVSAEALRIAAENIIAQLEAMSADAVDSRFVGAAEYARADINLDGKIDALDIGDYTTALTRIVDLTGDGKIKEDDLNRWQSFLTYIDYDRFLNAAGLMKADLDGDGDIDTVDKRLLTDLMGYRVDVNGDGVVNALDVADLREALEAGVVFGEELTRKEFYYQPDKSSDIKSYTAYLPEPLDVVQEQTVTVYAGAQAIGTVTVRYNEGVVSSAIPDVYLQPVLINDEYVKVDLPGPYVYAEAAEEARNFAVTARSYDSAKTFADMALDFSAKAEESALLAGGGSYDAYHGLAVQRAASMAREAGEAAGELEAGLASAEIENLIAHIESEIDAMILYMQSQGMDYQDLVEFRNELQAMAPDVSGVRAAEEENAALKILALDEMALEVSELMGTSRAAEAKALYEALMNVPAVQAIFDGTLDPVNFLNEASDLDSSINNLVNEYFDTFVLDNAGLALRQEIESLEASADAEYQAKVEAITADVMSLVAIAEEALTTALSVTDEELSSLSKEDLENELAGAKQARRVIQICRDLLLAVSETSDPELSAVIANSFSLVDEALVDVGDHIIGLISLVIEAEGAVFIDQAEAYRADAMNIMELVNGIYSTIVSTDYDAMTPQDAALDLKSRIADLQAHREAIMADTDRIAEALFLVNGSARSEVSVKMQHAGAMFSGVMEILGTAGDLLVVYESQAAGEYTTEAETIYNDLQYEMTQGAFSGMFTLTGDFEQDLALLQDGRALVFDSLDRLVVLHGLVSDPQDKLTVEGYIEYAEGLASGIDDLLHELVTIKAEENNSSLLGVATGIYSTAHDLLAGTQMPSGDVSDLPALLQTLLTSEFTTLVGAEEIQTTGKDAMDTLRGMEKSISVGGAYTASGQVMLDYKQDIQDDMVSLTNGIREALEEEGEGYHADKFAVFIDLINQLNEKKFTYEQNYLTGLDDAIYKALKELRQSSYNLLTDAVNASQAGSAVLYEEDLALRKLYEKVHYQENKVMTCKSIIDIDLNIAKAIMRGEDVDADGILDAGEDLDYDGQLDSLADMVLAGGGPEQVTQLVMAASEAEYALHKAQAVALGNPNNEYLNNTVSALVRKVADLRNVADLMTKAQAVMENTRRVDDIDGAMDAYEEFTQAIVTRAVALTETYPEAFLSAFNVVHEAMEDSRSSVLTAAQEAQDAADDAAVIASAIDEYINLFDSIITAEDLTDIINFIGGRAADAVIQARTASGVEIEYSLDPDAAEADERQMWTDLLGAEADMITSFGEYSTSSDSYWTAREDHEKALLEYE
ncbi:MAG: cysteine peptidase family C39 domain-containing protein, partial [Candidatus Omnitrophota bacterium]